MMAPCREPQLNCRMAIHEAPQADIARKALRTTLREFVIWKGGVVPIGVNLISRFHRDCDMGLVHESPQCIQ
jgi:hypothetical protein